MMEDVACSHCEWTGQVPPRTDTCPHCKKSGTLTWLASVIWALANPSNSPSN